MTGQTEAIESVLREFKIDARVDNVVHGSGVDRYEVKIGQGVKVEAIARLQKNFMYQCESESVRICSPIPGKSAVGIELPRPNREIVRLKDLVAADDHPLSVAIGKDIDGNSVTMNLGQMPHLLVAGSTGSGKSAFLNSMLVSLLNADAAKVRMILIDPKICELTPFEGVAHLDRPVIVEVDEAIDALEELAEDMDTRYQEMRIAKVRHIDDMDGYPYIVVVIDEWADIYMQAGERIQAPLVRLLQKGRAAGIHCAVATQRPSVDVINGVLKANLASRLAFATASAVDARVVMDEAGAEQLLGQGDALFRPIGARTAIRVQGAYVSDQEIRTAVKKATATARVEEMVNKLNCEPDPGPSVLDVINKMIREAEQVTTENKKYLEEFLKPKKWWGGSGGKLDMIAKAPEMLGTTSGTLAYIAETLKIIRDNALEES